MGEIRAVDVAVVGGGIIGLAAARAVLRREPDARLCVVEKENDVATHQTGRNSGVVHAGIYYPPDSLKARLCTAGRLALKEYTAEKGIRYDECGKLIVALRESELPGLDELHRRAVANGVPDVVRLDARQISEVEPAARGLAALHSPRTAITDYRAIARAYASDIAQANGEVHYGFAVARIEQDAASVTLHAADGRRVAASRVLVCAGLHGDRVAVMTGDGPNPRIVPFRGDYYELAASQASKVRGLVYPVPNPAFPFLGVHLTRTVDGRVLVGPNAVLATAREGYRLSTVRLKDLEETLAWPGFRRLAGRYWRVGLSEMRRSVSKREFAKEAAAFMPGILPNQLVRAKSGVRAQALDMKGELVDDFVITKVGRVVNVRNAPSPGATSSIPIGEELAHRLLDDAAGGTTKLG
jgi:L-2-hydroxyglutarate oxidase LhgO